MKIIAIAMAVLLAVIGPCEARGGHSGSHSSGPHSYHSSGTSFGGGYSGSAHASRSSSSHRISSHYVSASSRAKSGVHFTHGYYRKNGTYVQGHYSTNPNGTRNDNFSTRGNVNPYTGEVGTKPADGQ